MAEAVLQNVKNYAGQIHGVKKTGPAVVHVMLLVAGTPVIKAEHARLFVEADPNTQLNPTIPTLRCLNVPRRQGARSHLGEEEDAVVTVRPNGTIIVKRPAQGPQVQAHIVEALVYATVRVNKM